MSKLRAARTKAGLSQDRLAELAGTSQAQIAKLEKAERIKLDWAVRLAPHLGCDPVDLMDLGVITPQGAARLAASITPERQKGAQSLIIPDVDYNFTISGLPMNMKVRGEIAEQASKYASGNTEKIPVLSAARGGMEQEMFLEDGPIDWVERPSYLRNARDPYAIWVVGGSMFPRFRPAQVLHVNPYKPPTPGSGVIICKKNHAVLIKEWVGRSGDAISLREYQPENRVFDIPASEILSVHTVAGLQEP